MLVAIGVQLMQFSFVTTMVKTDAKKSQKKKPVGKWSRKSVKYGQRLTSEVARNRLAGLVTQASSDGGPILITHNQRKAVLLNVAEYSSLLETVYLLARPANARRLEKGLADYGAGKIVEHPLCD